MTGSHNTVDNCDVCLITLPYASLSRPSMALGLLKAILSNGGVKTKVLDANIWFAERVGLRRYDVCAEKSPIENLSGEWTFAGAAFADDPRREEKDAEYLRQVYERQGPSQPRGEGSQAAIRLTPREARIAALWAIRAPATTFVDDVARRALATGARVVGCTSTFEQHV